MNNVDETAIFSDLAAGLRERAADVGGEAGFASEVAAAATALPQRRRLILWPDSLTRRAGLILVAGLVGTGLIAAAIGSTSRPAPSPVAGAVANGPILVGETRRSWWVDPTSGAKLVGAGYPDMPEGIQDASFSPDGQRVALVVDGELELYDIATAGRSVLLSCPQIGWTCRLETERRFSIAWSPDGRLIAVGRAGALLVVDVASATITMETPPVAGQSSYRGPSWSPDGRWIAFEFVRPFSEEERYVEAIRPDGSDRHRVSAPTPQGALGASVPAWSADGTRIFYETSDPFLNTGDFYTSSMNIYAAAQPVTDGSPVGEPERVVELVTYHCLGFCPTFTLSPDGSSFLLDSGGGVFVIPIDGSPRLALGNPEVRPLAWRPVPAGR